jgi:hypothetical protein
VQDASVALFREALQVAKAALVGMNLDALGAGELADTALACRRELEPLAALVGLIVNAAVGSGAHRTHGAVNPVSWLASGAGIHPSRARSELSAALAISASEKIKHAVEEGTISTDHAGELSKLVHADAFEEHAEDLIHKASRMSPLDLRDEVSLWNTRHDPKDDDDVERSRRRKRFHRQYRRADGLVAGEYAVTADDAQVIANALTHLVNGQLGDGSDRTSEQRSADALVELCAAYGSQEVTGGREKPELIAVVELADLESRAGRAVLVGGGTVDPGALRRICCDARITRLVLDAEGQPLDVGRTSRTGTPAQYRALLHRDGGCVVPGCDRPVRWTDIHHWRQAWEHGGTTDLGNLCLVCSAHHHLVHDDGWTLTRTPDLRWQLVDPAGRARPPGPPPPSRRRREVQRTCPGARPAAGGRVAGHPRPPDPHGELQTPMPEQQPLTAA